jgi:hypothetical protein
MDSHLNVEIMNVSKEFCHFIPHKIIMHARCINNQTAMSRILMEELGYWSLKVKPCYICNYSQFLDNCTDCPAFGVKLLEPAVVSTDMASGPWKCEVQSKKIGIGQMKLWQSDTQKTMTTACLAQQTVCFYGTQECYVTFQASSKTLRKHLEQGTTIGMVQRAPNLPLVSVCNKTHHFLVKNGTRIPENTSLEIEVQTMESSAGPEKCQTECHGMEVACTDPVLKVKNGFKNRYVFSEKMLFTLHNRTNQSVYLIKDQVIIVATCFNGRYHDMSWRHTSRRQRKNNNKVKSKPLGSNRVVVSSSQ